MNDANGDTETDHADDLDLAAQSPQEYIEARRLKQIQDAREEVYDRDDETDMAVHTGRITSDRKDALLFQAVKRYVREIWNLLKVYTSRSEDTYFTHDAHLGTMEFGNSGETIEFHGLISYLHSQPYQIEEYEHTREYPHGPDHTETRQVKHPIPARISWAAFDAVDAFLAEIGLDLDIDAGDEDAEFEYDDLLDLD